MRRQRVRLAFFMVVVGAFAAELYVLAPERERAPIYRQAAYDRIRPGMTVDEVESFLGKDRGFIPDGFSMTGPGVDPLAGRWGSTWFGADVVVEVWFGNLTNRVEDKESRPVIRQPQPSLIRELRRWLGL
jgi:hypothetical protein